MVCDACQRHRTARRGFTLAEATLAMVILGMAAAGVLLPFASGASVQAEGMHRSLGAGLANDLLEQIVATPFKDIVNRYNYTEPQGQIKDASDTIFTDPIYANYSRDVSCTEVRVPQQRDIATVAPNFILARVRVYYRAEPIVTVYRLISE
jgi:prepilin-type N-terminal cleavage/methylation domain-containing protein